MKLLFSLSWLALIVCFSCQNQQESANAQSTVAQVEQHLMPSILIEEAGDSYFSLEERMKHYKVPGVSIALIDGGKIAWAKGYGFTSADSQQAVDSLTMFQAASISKPVAALAALKLVEQSKLRLDQDVNEVLLDWKIKASPFTAEQPVTLEHLLTHTAGLTVHGFGGYASGDSLPTVINILQGEKPANSAEIMTDTLPGTLWRYSGGGYTVLQKMMEDVTGKPFPEIMDSLVLSPLGMEHSTYQQPLPNEYHNHASIGHRANGEKVAGNWHTYPEMAAAGLWTTPTDLAKYLIEVQQSIAGQSNLVISQAMTERMLTKHMKDWGLGPGLMGDNDSLRFGHGGANEGYRCQMVAFVHQGKGAVIMTNSDNGSDLINEILRSISEVYQWNTFLPTRKKIVSVPTEILTSYNGKYQYQLNPGFAVQVYARDTALWVKQLWDNTAFIVLPESDSSFFKRDNGMTFTFANNAENKPSTLTVDGEYQLQRVR